MNGNDSGVADARDRLREKAQNEATCIALNDMLKDAQKEIVRLREENERLRKDAEVGAAIQRAAAELPREYIVGISVEADAATVELCFPTGHIKTMDVDDDNRLAAEINAAIDAARSAKTIPEPAP